MEKDLAFQHFIQANNIKQIAKGFLNILFILNLSQKEHLGRFLSVVLFLELKYDKKLLELQELSHNSDIINLLNNFHIYINQNMHQAWQKGRTFPTKLAHLNAFGQKLIPMDTNLNSPEYKDTPYRTRRLAIGEISKEFQIGNQIPQVSYTHLEHETWRKALKKLNFYQRSVMSRIYLNNMKQLEKNLDFSSAIPKMNDLSNYLKSKTGFQIKPVAGMIDQREFLNCLAFKVFCSGQFIRHHQCIEFTTEPDIIHEYVGHIPMLVNPHIAEISQTIGLLSLGAPEEDLKRLGNAYLALIQLGICLQDGKRKAYGASIAACTADLIKISEDRYNWKEFQPETDCQDKEQNYQIPFESFYVSKTIQAATESLLKIGKDIKKSFRCQYDANKKEILVMDII